MPFQMDPLIAPPSWNMEHKGQILSPVSFEEMFRDTYCILPVFITPEMFAGRVSYVPNLAETYKRNVYSAGNKRSEKGSLSDGSSAAGSRP